MKALVKIYGLRFTLLRGRELVSDFINSSVVVARQY